MLAMTAETIEDCDEACDHLRVGLIHADGERVDIIRELIDCTLDRRLELMRAVTSPGGATGC